MLLSTFLFSLMNALVKLIPNIPAVEIVLFRSLVSLVLSYTLLKSLNVPIWGNKKKYLILRGITGAIALILFFTTLQAMPLATAVTLQFLSPIFTAIIGIFLVKERVRLLQWLFIIIAFSGVVLVKGFDPRITPFLFSLGIISAVFSGFSYNFIRKLKLTEHPLVIVFYFPLVTLPVTGIISYFDWVQPTGWEWLILLLIGIFTQFAQYYMTKAFQVEELANVASLQYLGIIYALGLGLVFFDETFHLMSYIGMMLLLFGVFMNIWYKNYLIKKIKTRG